MDIKPGLRWVVVDVEAEDDTRYLSGLDDRDEPGRDVKVPVRPAVVGVGDQGLIKCAVGRVQ